MSTRVHQNIALMSSARRLPQIFSASADATLDACINASPNTLNSNLPSKKDAMGITGNEGVISFFHDYTGSDPDFTLYFWSEELNQFTAAKGWILSNEATAGHTKTVPAYSLVTMTVPEGKPFFIQSSVEDAPRNLWIYGTRKYALNPNADFTPKQANTA